MIGWLDCSAGASGDMLLGALVGAGVPLAVLQEAVDAVCPEPVRLRAEPVTRCGLAATKVSVDAPASEEPRSWADVDRLLGDHPARAVFARLAEAEGAVHGIPAAEVHFHEVGALDAIADVVAVTAGLEWLGLTGLHAGPVVLGSGRTAAAHGSLPVPAPAVLALLSGRPVLGGPSGFEATTPTGAALLAERVTAWGPLPPLRVDRVGTGAGSRDLPDLPNVLRLVLGEPLGEPAAEPAGAHSVLLETNVDDLDPRVWPTVLADLLAAGAQDAWLTPVLMKKGRPAHVLSVLGPPELAERLREVVFTRTSTIGLREVTVRRHVLPRTVVTVDVLGHTVRVKTASQDGRMLNAQPEFVDVVAAAASLGRPVVDVLLHAQAAAAALLAPPP